MAAFSKIPVNTFEHLAPNAGMVLKHFNPADGSYAESDFLGATTGGLSVNVSTEYRDEGEDIDNCPKNTKELKRVDDVTVAASGTLVTIDEESAEWLMSHCDAVTANGVTKLVPRTNIDIENDFRELWIVLDYTNINTGNGAGFLVVHMMNVLSTGGFQLQTTDKGKTQFAFEFTAHFSLDAQDTVPYEVYMRKGSNAGQTPEVMLDRHNANVAVGDEITLNTVRLIPANTTVTWSSSATGKAEVSGGVVTGVSAGSAIITASITVEGVSYTDTCTVIVVS